MFNSGNDSTKIREYCIDYYNLKELAAIYKRSTFKMRKRMKPYKDQIGEPEDGNDYSPKQVALIFELVELPSDVRIIRSNG